MVLQREELTTKYWSELSRKCELIEKLEERFSSGTLPAWWRQGPGTTSATQLQQDKSVVSQERSPKVVDMRQAALLPKYLNDIWMSEEPPPYGDTFELLESVEENNKRRFKEELGENELRLSHWLRRLADALDRLLGKDGTSKSRSNNSNSSSAGDRWWLVSRNLYEVLCWLFDGAERNHIYTKGLENMLNNEFNVDFVMRVHSTVMCTLTTTTELRSRNASPNGSPVLYEIPRRIRPKLEALLDFTREWLKKCESTWEALKCGTLFFSEFLLIHPFRDGNGRTARLLLSHLLRFHTWVPISLYLYRGKDKNREIYINVLEERVNQSSPDALFFYVVDCYRSTITTAEWALQ